MDNRTLEEVRKNETKLIEEIKSLEKQLEYLRSGEYYNQLRFENEMLQNVLDNGEVSKEDKEFIDMTNRNTELLEENQKYKEVINKAIEFSNKNWGTWCSNHLEYMTELQNILKEVE